MAAERNKSALFDDINHEKTEELVSFFECRETLADIINEYLKENNMSKAEFGRRILVDRSTISKILEGKPVSRITLININDELHEHEPEMTLAYLFESAYPEVWVRSIAQERGFTKEELDAVLILCGLDPTL